MGHPIRAFIEQYIEDKKDLITGAEGLLKALPKDLLEMEITFSQWQGLTANCICLLDKIVPAPTESGTPRSSGIRSRAVLAAKGWAIRNLDDSMTLRDPSDENKPYVIITTRRKCKTVMVREIVPKTVCGEIPADWDVVREVESVG